MRGARYRHVVLELDPECQAELNNRHKYVVRCSSFQNPVKKVKHMSKPEGEKRITKTSQVKAYLAKHPDAKTNDVVNALAAQTPSVVVSASQVSLIKNPKEKGTTIGTKRTKVTLTTLSCTAEDLRKAAVYIKSFDSPELAKQALVELEAIKTV